MPKFGESGNRAMEKFEKSSSSLRLSWMVDCCSGKIRKIGQKFALDEVSSVIVRLLLDFSSAKVVHAEEHWGESLGITCSAKKETFVPVERRAAEGLAEAEEGKNL